MKTFHLVRAHDVSGVSGTGTVAKGVIFDDGAVALRWNTEPRSTAIYDSIDDVTNIHGHTGLTQVVMQPDNEEALAHAAEEALSFDPTDRYEFSNPGKHIPGFTVGYYAAIDRIQDLLYGRITSWKDDRPTRTPVSETND